MFDNSDLEIIFFYQFFNIYFFFQSHQAPVPVGDRIWSIRHLHQAG